MVVAEVIARRLVWIRQLRNLSQAEVAAGANVGRATLSAAEAGRTRTQVGTLQTLAGYYGVPVAFFFGADFPADLLLEDARRRA